MRAKGIAYNTGFVVDGHNSIDHLDPDRVGRELTIIRDDLHCTAVHLVGGDPERLELAARHAAGLGLEIWFSPYPIEQTPAEIQTLFADCADRAERLRANGAEVVFVAGVELTIMNPGFVDGARLDDRLATLFADPAARPRRIAQARAALDTFLGQAVAEIRTRFHGPVTYAAIQFEGVDWSRFDIITYELIRSAEVEPQFREAVRTLTAQPRPVAVTGFSTATWRGAAAVAPQSMAIVEHDESTGRPRRLNGDYQRDEQEQATYLAEMLEIFDTEGVDSTFVHLFALDNYPHRPDGDPRDDLDIASPAIVKVFENRRGDTYPDMPWEPKAAFTTVADHYGRSRNRRDTTKPAA
ncbi:hypothetical protein AB0M54_10050 [Actinoplanes sp. NPDC051470]|uniref:hypothetical protein n=1 Tax=Actinoplanes sp. NPDC051470 TaxID=3157224 RepID=UPI00342AC279